jgi:anthranilate/para-aminobenzoate synthase component I
VFPSRRLDLRADPLELVLPLAAEPGAFLSFDGARATFGCRPLAASSDLDPEPELALGAHTSSAPRWFGLLPYEAFRGGEREWARDRRAAPLVENVLWQRYGAVAVFEDGAVRLEGDDLRSLNELEDLLRCAATEPQRPGEARLDLEDPEPAEHHERRIRRALDHIERGNLYQVNLARRFDFRVQGDAFAVLAALGPAGRARFASAGCFQGLSWVCASPELFLELTPAGQVVTSPIKGTRPRGATAGEDERLRLELDANPKERAELAMVIDVERNDLGRVAAPGSVRLTEAPHVVTHATVHHREATVTAQLRAGVARRELLEATLPSGSVTGAPKLRAMELIAEYEAERRGLYTGALGALGHDGSLRLSMAIRTLVFRNGRGHYFSGGGIVADSDPAAEVAETLWKARQLAALATAFRR